MWAFFNVMIALLLPELFRIYCCLLCYLEFPLFIYLFRVVLNWERGKWRLSTRKYQLHWTDFTESEWQHEFLQLQHNSEVNRKWQQWTKLIPPWSPSAWTSAKHWPARARSSTSHLLLVPLSPSPWTPGARFKGPRRRQAPQRSGEMPSVGKSSTKESSKSLQLGFPLKVMQLPLRRQNVTFVNSKQLLKRGLGSTWEWSTKQQQQNWLPDPRTSGIRENPQHHWIAPLSFSTPGKRTAKTATQHSFLDTSVPTHSSVMDVRKNSTVKKIWTTTASEHIPTNAAFVNNGSQIIQQPTSTISMNMKTSFHNSSTILWLHGDLKVNLTGGVQLTMFRCWQYVLFSHVTQIKYTYLLTLLTY